MTAERHARLKTLFDQVLDLPAGERDAFLREQCQDDAELRRELEEMLAVDTGHPEFLKEPITATPGLLGGAPPIERLGPFRVVRLLGEGGMGAVYEAEQEKPRRRVALKVLHPSLATRQMLGRFELEAEVLGRLQHPGIARIYEAGTDDCGHGPQPWLAMELIDGLPLTRHCQQNHLSLEARLLLVAKVCDAVHHAHQRGIVHRDLKPANVLVEASGEPKVLDFGIARATGSDLPQVTLRTDPGQIIGTLQYMSPEQAAADPDAIDVRTDVYSLGAMLYELVAGRPPLELGRLPMHEALRRVIDVEPSPLRTTAGRVPTDVAVVAHKALAKDKDHRYGSAAELAADLRRFLNREPILALPPTTWYRLRRFAARNKALVGGLATTFAALVIGLSIALWQRNEAREALALAEAINRFVLSDLLMAPSPERLGPEVRVADVLAPAVRSAERAFAGRPRLAAEVLDAVAGGYRALIMLPEAERLCRRALELLGDETKDRLALKVRGRLFATVTFLGRAAEAVTLGEAVVADSVAVLGATDPDTLERRVSLAGARWMAGDKQRALAELREVTALQAQLLGPEHYATLETKAGLALRLAETDAFGEATTLMAETLATQERVLGAEHPLPLVTRSYLGWMHTMASEWQQAEAVYTGLRPALEAVYGPEHPAVASAGLRLAECLMRRKEFGAAEEIVRAALRTFERRFGPQHDRTCDARQTLAEVLARKGDHPAAIAEAARIVELRRATGVVDDALGRALNKLGRCHQEAGQLREAVAAFTQAAEVHRQASPKPTDALAQTLYNLGVATRSSGDAKGSIAPLREALAIDIATWGKDSPNAVMDRYNLARSLQAAGEHADAITEIRAALASAAVLKFEAPRVLGYRGLLGRSLLESAQDAEAEKELLAVVGGFQELSLPDDGAAKRARSDLVRLYEKQGRTEEAARYREPR